MSVLDVQVREDGNGDVRALLAYIMRRFVARAPTLETCGARACGYLSVRVHGGRASRGRARADESVLLFFSCLKILCFEFRARREMKKSRIYGIRRMQYWVPDNMALVGFRPRRPDTTHVFEGGRNGGVARATY